LEGKKQQQSRPGNPKSRVKEKNGEHMLSSGKQNNMKQQNNHTGKTPRRHPPLASGSALEQCCRRTHADVVLQLSQHVKPLSSGACHFRGSTRPHLRGDVLQEVFANT